MSLPESGEAYRRAADAFRSATAGLAVAELDAAVPTCPGWTVSDLLTHVAENHEQVFAEVGIEPVGADVLASWHEQLSSHPRTSAQAVDLAVHAWDVGRATGRHVRLDAPVVRFLDAFATDAGPLLAADEAFAPCPLTADEVATLDEHDRVLTRYGRDPR
ncbi:maleylpyruvate isomerase N-terminal domain-containing protein [Nocardioides bruguierae]|uniref:maleylpyruvate isomerase N-terminal domain-containing protein n=1 Tax=Nocardioides bruguierae TaxID=2945102 RepID=UPI00202162E5|nr:maleylpyruvate isomerase N-terminal domain-containing protein [Nocardioides bruguierae]MCL8024290.1 maleylpyruvate isomerase N-terminal domain-containing protein [Nocardioides bruguierae]